MAPRLVDLRSHGEAALRSHGEAAQQQHLQAAADAEHGLRQLEHLQRIRLRHGHERRGDLEARKARRAALAREAVAGGFPAAPARRRRRGRRRVLLRLLRMCRRRVRVRGRGAAVGQRLRAGEDKAHGLRRVDGVALRARAEGRGFNS